MSNPTEININTSIEDFVKAKLAHLDGEREKLLSYIKPVNEVKKPDAAKRTKSTAAANGKNNGMQARVYDTIKDHGPLTNDQLDEILGGQPQSIRVATSRLCKQGKLVAIIREGSRVKVYSINKAA